MSSRKSKTSTLSNKRVLVAGGAGSIGSELVRQLSVENRVYVLDINESGIFDITDELRGRNVWGRVGNIRDYTTVRDVFEDFKPEIVFNAAAYKHVPLMEYTPLEAIKTNVEGHHNLLHVAKTWECVEKFVFISTDKAVSTNSIMGATKRLSEVLTINQGAGYVVVRFGNVMNSRGSLLKIWQRQVDNDEPITITDERMERYMMTIPEAVKLVIKAATEGEGGEIFVMDMGEKVNINDLAEQILEKTGGEKKVIGMRDGETLTEELMLQEEKERAIKTDGFWIIK